MGLLPFTTTFSLATATSLLLQGSAKAQLQVAEIKAVCQAYPAPSDITDMAARVNWAIAEYWQSKDRLTPEQTLDLDILTARYMAESYAEGEVAFYAVLYRVFERTYVFGEGLEDWEKDTRFKFALSQVLPEKLYMRFLTPSGNGKQPYSGMLGFFKAATLGLIPVEDAIQSITEGTRGDTVRYLWTATGTTLNTLIIRMIDNVVGKQADEEKFAQVVDTAKEAVDAVIKVYREEPIRRGADGFDKKFGEIVERFSGEAKRSTYPRTVCIAKVCEEPINRAPFILKDTKDRICRTPDGEAIMVDKYMLYQLWVPIDQYGNEVGISYFEETLASIKKLAKRKLT